MTTFMSRHSIPPELATCLTTLLKQYIPDSKIIQKMTLSSTKARYLTLRGLAEHAEKETSEKVRKCDACSIAIDESEVNGRSELEVMVKFASQEGGIENKHLGCINLEVGDAETIKNSIFDFLDEKQIDFRTKMIDVGMDGCSTMQGHKSGVITRMVEDVEELQSTGSCKAHNLSNVMKHATEAFDPDVKDALVDVYIDLGGAKGYGLKKKKNFESLCSRLGFKPYTFKRFVDTRFRTHRACIEPVLKNFPYLVKYYKSVKKLTPRQTRLKKFFVDNHDLTKLKLLFVSDANSEFDKGIDFFEEKQSHVHNTGDMLEKILVGQYRKIFDQFEIDTLMEDKTLEEEIEE